MKNKNAEKNMVKCTSANFITAQNGKVGWLMEDDEIKEIANPFSASYETILPDNDEIDEYARMLNTDCETSIEDDNEIEEIANPYKAVCVTSLLCDDEDSFDCKPLKLQKQGVLDDDDEIHHPATLSSSSSTVNPPPPESLSIGNLPIATQSGAKHINVCEIAEQIQQKFIVNALFEPKRLFIYDEELGFFNQYDVRAFALFLRCIYDGSEIDHILRPSNSATIFQRLLTTPTIQDSLDAYDRDQPFVNVLNGIVNLRTGQMVPHSPKNKFTSALQGKYLVSAYTPPQKFNAFVEKNFPLPEDALLFRQVMFYMLSWLRSAKLAFYLKGEMNTGKSVIAKLLRRLIGEENTSQLRLPQLLGRWGASGIVHSRLNISTEVERETLTRGSELKGYIALDPQPCEFKGENFYTAILHTCFLLIGNGMLRVNPRMADTALLERFLFMEAKNPVSKEEWDTDLLEKLWLERDAILTELIDVGIDWFQSGMKFIETETSLKLAREFKCPKGSIGYYLDECYNAVPEGREWTCSIRAGFEKWQKENGFSETFNRSEFSDALRLAATQRGFKSDKFRINGEGPRHGYRGLVSKNHRVHAIVS